MFFFDPKALAFIDERILQPPPHAVAVTVHERDEVLAAVAVPGYVLSASKDGKPLAVASGALLDISAHHRRLKHSINAIFQSHMAAIADGYPMHERESWPVQLEEAKALQADPEATTPWLDACAAARGLDKAELAARVLAKDAAYRLISGTLSGIRQRHEDAIAKLETVEQAQAYDVQAWWPSEEGEPQQRQPTGLTKA